jgi:diguanylate cyclase (GGDEF)-like protein/PAS domain S-box-containing protein
MLASAARRRVHTLRSLLPEGGALTPTEWRQRHRVILALLWAHAGGIALFALIRGLEPGHAVTEGLMIAAWAVVAGSLGGRRIRSGAASLGLFTASALLVHLTDGAIEAHFHFFVMITVIALYQDWMPFLLTLLFVVLEHGVTGVVMPTAVYNHAAAWAEPWKWAVIHGGFVLAASAANVAHWRLSELVQRERSQSQKTVSRLAAIVTSSEDAIISMDARAQVISWNAAAEALFGFTADEMNGQSIMDLVPHDRRAELDGVRRRLRAGLQVDPRESRMLRKDGSQVDVSVSLSPIRDVAGDVVGSALIARDITDRIRVEGALRESQRTLSTLLSNLPGMAYRCRNDRDWTSEFVSEGCLELTGIAPADFMEQRASYSELIHADDRERLWRDTQEAVAKRRAFRQTYRITTAQGWEKWVWEHGRGVYDAEGNLQALEGFIIDISERRDAELALAHHAQHDPLTDLPNRVVLRHEAQEALRASRNGGTPVALLVMDLDRFKEVNDTLGHGNGDRLLQDVAVRLKSALGEAGLLARLGGDEFAVLMPGADAARVSEVAQRLLHAFDEPFAVENHHLALGASMGGAVCPDHGTDSETLLRRADVAMYVAKRAANGFALYDARFDDNSPDRLALATELRQALEDGHLELYYQPKLWLADGSVAGVEALLRWSHPRRGPIPPDQFIPLAEQTGLIHALTRWVLDAALRQYAAWRREGLEVPVAVNFSMRNLQDPEIADTVASLLERWNVAPSALEIEITESTLMADPTGALDVLGRMRALGVRVAIDDFGTGYSSLAYLKQLPVDGVKVDRSFVREMLSNDSDRVIVRATIDLAHNLGLRVVAEGVEDAATYALLGGLGCDEGQGYHVQRPLAADDATAWLRRRRYRLANAA